MGAGDLEINSFSISANILKNQFNIGLGIVDGNITGIDIHRTVDRGDISNYDIILTHDDAVGNSSYEYSVFTVDIDSGIPIPGTILVDFPFGTTITGVIQKIAVFKIKNKGTVTTYTTIVVSGGA